MASEKVSILQIRPGCLLIYEQYLSPRWRDPRDRFEPDVPATSNKKYTGLINQSSASKLRFAINLLLAISPWQQVINHITMRYQKFKVNFITLTLPSMQLDITDRQIKKECLEPMLRYLRLSYGMTSYVWRAELQKNDNLHFHITTNVYIPYEKIRDKWNQYLSKFHFIEAFQKKFGHSVPNSTDVHSVYSIRNLAAYLVKYMTKPKHQQRPIDGKVWDCSKNLKLKDRATIEIDGNLFYQIKNLIGQFPDRFVENDRCSMLNLTQSEMKAYLPNHIWSMYAEWLLKIKNYNS